MSKKDDLKIDIMSSIDDEIIEKHTKKRFDLLSGKGFGRKRKTIAAIIAFAACLAMLASFIVVILPLIPTGQIPVYQGMTVSNEAPNITVKTSRPAISMLSTTSKHRPDDDKHPPELPDNIPLVEGSDRALYYAKPNEDIYITIHLTNPDQFEILSFTLNDVKYQSYMFEPGSDSEALILKLNVGDVQGMVEYTIDAIKYVDGTQIKDVIMNGEKTVKVGVYPEKQPTAELGEITSDLFEISLSASVSDPLSLIKDSNGSVRALLYEGDELVREKTLGVGQEAHLSFDGLDTGRSYILRIVAYYDALDGAGFTAHLLDELDVATLNLVNIANVSASEDCVRFDLDVVEGYSVTIEKTELILPDGRALISIDGAASEFDLYYGSYQILVTYSYDSENGRTTATSITTEPISTKTLDLSKTLSNGKITKEYSGSTQIWNETIQAFTVHQGVDYAPNDSDGKVHVTFSGEVSDVYRDELYGTTVIVSSFDGSLTVYYQNVTDVQVEKGDIVNGGQVIATVYSDLWEAAEVDHVHIVVYENGEMVDPIKYFN